MLDFNLEEANEDLAMAQMFPHVLTLTSGFVVRQAIVGRSFIDFLQGGDTVVVTFENAVANIKRDDRLRDGWGGLKFLIEQGCSVIAVKTMSVDWYRQPNLIEWFNSGELKSFLARFKRVVFTGSSMGAFAAITFSRVRPGSVVVAHGPQSTLDKRLVPWETRYGMGRQQNWDGGFGDAAEAVPFAEKIYLTYDPFHTLDLQHMKRLAARDSGGTIVHLKMPFLGHVVANRLVDIGLLKEVQRDAIHGRLTSAKFAALIRARRRSAHYYENALRVVKKPKFQNAMAIMHVLTDQPS